MPVTKLTIAEHIENGHPISSNSDYSVKVTVGENTVVVWRHEAEKEHPYLWYLLRDAAACWDCPEAVAISWDVMRGINLHYIAKTDYNDTMYVKELRSIYLTNKYLFLGATGFKVHLPEENGYYWAARFCNVKVLRFSIGMGPVIWSRKVGRDQTEWAVSLLPLGGYVKMLDAREADMNEVSQADAQREFTRQSVYKRMAIVAAGPFANMVLAVVIYAGLFMHGTTYIKPLVQAPDPATSAFAAGFRGGDEVTRINGYDVNSWEAIEQRMRLTAKYNQGAVFTVRREGRSSEVILTKEDVARAAAQPGMMNTLGLEPKRVPATVRMVQANSPAEKAGLKEGDLITKVAGVTVADGKAATEIVRKSPGRARAHQAYRIKFL